MQYQKFNEVYKLLLNEDVSANVIHNLNNKKMNDDDKSNKSLTDIDELTEENMTTIEEDSNIEEQDESGWNESIEDICSDIIYKFDGFAYELRNCNRGSFTGAKNIDDLINYLEGLKNNIDETIEKLQNIE